MCELRAVHAEASLETSLLVVRLYSKYSTFFFFLVFLFLGFVFCISFIGNTNFIDGDKTHIDWHYHLSNALSVRKVLKTLKCSILMNVYHIFAPFKL